MHVLKNLQHDVIVTLLFTVPEKEHDIRSQIKDINDVVNNIRDNDHGQSNLSFIKIDNDEFDLSQESNYRSDVSSQSKSTSTSFKKKMIKIH